MKVCWWLAIWSVMDSSSLPNPGSHCCCCCPSLYSALVFIFFLLLCLAFMFVSLGALSTGFLLFLLASLALWQGVRLGALPLSLSSCLVFTVSHKHSPSWLLCVGLLLWWGHLLLDFLLTSFRILAWPSFYVALWWSPPQSSRALPRYSTRSWRGERDMCSCNNNKLIYLCSIIIIHTNLQTSVFISIFLAKKEAKL